MGFLVLDHKEYKVGIKSIRRKFAVEDGENSIQVKNGRNLRDIVGTRYNYTLEIESIESAPGDYDALYQAISAPVQSHTITVPYGQGTLTFEADIQAGRDSLIRPTTVRKWGDLQVDFIAKEPQRRG